jgi:signal transduction histidine kinase
MLIRTLHDEDDKMPFRSLIDKINQEAVNNAVKYSRAENLSIELTSNPHLSVKIEDDGVGFDLDDEDISGSGIAIMNHRAKVLGGEFEIERTGENRTAVKCEFPNLTS